MNYWNETRDLFARIRVLLKQGRSGALATLIQAEGSTYRKPGAKLLVEDDGRLTGHLSGGCVEEDLRTQAIDVIREGYPRLITYDTRNDLDDVGGFATGCNGSIRVFVEPIQRYTSACGSLLEALDGDTAIAAGICVSEDQPGRFSIAIGADNLLFSSGVDPALESALLQKIRTALEQARTGIVTVGAEQVYIETLVPPPHFLVCGGGRDAAPLVALASQCGFRVTVVDDRSAYLDKELFPSAWRIIKQSADAGWPAAFPVDRTHVLIKSHSFWRDQAWLNHFISSGVPYIGLLGPRHRREALLEGVDSGHRDILYAPVGMDVGAQGPEQIAVSIVAELLGVYTGHSTRTSHLDPP